MWSILALVFPPLVVSFFAEKTMPKVDALISAADHACPQRSEDEPYVICASGAPQNVLVSALLSPPMTPLFTRRTELSLMRLELSAFRSTSTTMPLIVAALGRENPKPVAFR